MFFDYRQNNSGGSFRVDDKVGHCLIIEANDAKEANEIAQKYIYFDGCEVGLDCSCCGDRWSLKWSDEGTENPCYYENSIFEPEKLFGDFRPLEKEWICDIYYKSGEHKRIEYDAQKEYEKAEKQRREKSNKLWATSISFYGIHSNEPVRIYEKSYYKKVYYWDKEGNFGGEVKLSQDKTYYENSDNINVMDYFFFASKNKKDVEDFIAGALYGYECLDFVVKSIIEHSNKPGFPVISFADNETYKSKKNKFFKLGLEKSLNQMRRYKK